MCTRLNLVFCILVLALAGSVTAYGFSPNADASLVGLWKLDEMSGTIAADSSGNGNDGTLQGDPQWVEGMLDGALDLDGNGDYVDCGNDAVFDITEQVTLAAWVKTRDMGNGEDNPWVGKGDTAYALKGFRTGYDVEFFTYDGAWHSAHYATDESFNDEWHHVAGTYDGSTLMIYVDGVLGSGATLAYAGSISSVTYNINIGRNSQQTSRHYEGLIDDVRIYNRALTDAEIPAVMTGGGNPAVALAPKPENEATDVSRDVVLTWTSGPYAATHDVYLGTVPDDVNNASDSNPLGVLASLGQDVNMYDPPGRLEFGQTYYWRIDEVNAPPDNTVHTGNVWSFTVEPFAYQVENIVATASCPNDVGNGPEKAVNGSGLTGGQHGVDEEDMWLGEAAEGDVVWIQFDFDRVYKIHEAHVWNYNMLYETALGFGLKDITIQTSTDGETWAALDDFQLAQGPGTAYDGETIDFGGIAVKAVRIDVHDNWGPRFNYGLSEVQFYYVPAHTRDPQPALDATGVGLDPVLTWRAGREADSHEVSFDTNAQAVADGTAVVDTTSVPSYGVSALDLGTTYYWKVDEVNQAEAITSWPGDVWSFTTQQYTVVDDMESYTEDEGNEVFMTWADGYLIDDNGSVVGYEDRPYVDTATLHGGSQSMPMYYGQTSTATSSVAECAFDGPQDWTKGKATTLTLYFYGDVENSVDEPMWVRLTDQTGKSGTVTYGTGVAESADNQAVAAWHEWSISLDQFGVNLARVSSMEIGFGGSGPQTEGLMLFDDIRLYPAPPVSTPVLAAHWALDGDATDSSGNGNDGTVNGGATWVAAGKIGGALSLNGTDAYVDCGNSASLDITEAITLSAWVHTADANNAEHNPYVGKGDQAYAIKHSTDNQIQTFIYDGGWYSANYSIDPSFNDEWHHVASTYDGLHLRLYVDGVLRTTLEHAGSIDTTTYNANIGRNAQNTDRLYEGLIDEVRIYDGALSPDEVVELATP